MAASLNRRAPNSPSGDGNYKPSQWLRDDISRNHPRVWRSMRARHFKLHRDAGRMGPEEQERVAEELAMDTLEARSGETLRQDYIERARELKPMLAAAGDECERIRGVTPECVAAMKERGIFRMLLPRSLGGAELDPLTYTEV